MKNNLRVVLYVLAAGLAFILWQRWTIANLPDAPAVAVYEESVSGGDIMPSTASLGGTAVSSSVVDAQSVDHVVDMVQVKTDVLDLIISTRGATIIEGALLEYPSSLDDKTPLLLVHGNNPNRMQVSSGVIDATRGSANSPTHLATWQARQNSYVLAEGEDELRVPFFWENEEGVMVEKVFVFERGSYAFNIEQIVHNLSDKPWEGIAYSEIAFGYPQGSRGLANVATFTGAVISSEQDRYDKIKLKDIASIRPQDTPQSNKYKKDIQSTTGWVAMIQHYFLAALIPQSGEVSQLYTQYNGNLGDHIVGVRSDRVQVEAQGSYKFENKAYIGPKIVKNLEAVAPYLDKTVDYGMLFMISEFMFKVMEFIHGFLGNWGWSIVIVTLLIKLIFFMPSAWAYKSMAKMRALQPEMLRLREKYGDDRQMMGQEMMKLYRREKVNPASGCLPMLLQIPFFIAFYYMLAESVELRQAPWILWIKDLSVMDPYFILPVINTALMFLQQRLNPPPTDPMQQKVMMAMPLVFGFMFMWFPSGLVLYWTVSNAFGIVQQYVMNKRYGTAPKPHNHHPKKDA